MQNTFFKKNFSIFVGIFTWFIYNGEQRKLKNEEFFLSKMNLYKDPRTSKLCYKPTPENPFMNVLMSDYTQQPNRPQACNVTKTPIKKLAQKYFDLQHLNT